MTCDISCLFTFPFNRGKSRSAVLGCTILLIFCSRELHVLLESKGNEAPQLELSYSVGGVSWTPLYDIRLSSATATLQVSPVIRRR